MANPFEIETPSKDAPSPISQSAKSGAPQPSVAAQYAAPSSNFREGPSANPFEEGSGDKGGSYQGSPFSQPPADPVKPGFPTSPGYQAASSVHVQPNYSSGFQQPSSVPAKPFNSTTTPPGGSPQGYPNSATSSQQQPQWGEPGQPPQQPQPTGTSKFWTIEFYQQFFNVNTRQVLLRISNTLIPINPPDFLLGRDWHYSAGSAEQQRQEQEPDMEAGGVMLSRDPDLYGPFWICTTLWMLLGIISNIMSKISYNHDPTKQAAGKWKYDFSKASVACVVIYLYCLGMGLLLWGLMLWKGLPATLIDTLCLYGYSMFIFILTAILCMVPITWFQWVIVMVGGAWSTTYLLINFWKMWQATLQRKWFIGIVACVSILHMLITLSFKFYFLNYDI